MQRPLIAILLLCSLLLAACGRQEAPAGEGAGPVVTVGPSTELSGIRTYLLDKLGALKQSTEQLKGSADRYHQLAQSASGDYAALWQSRRAEVTALLNEARGQWMAAGPLYEQVEGIVAGVPYLARYAVILDAGSSAAEGGDNVAPVDVELPDGRVLVKPGNLFGLTGRALWGTDPEYVVAGVAADFDGDGATGFGEALPDAAVLKGTAEALDRYTAELLHEGQEWTPSVPDAFTALAVMVPMMGEYFESWKNAHAAGDESARREPLGASPLSDIQDILGGLLVVYADLSPRIREADPEQDRQIGAGLRDLQAFVAGARAKEEGGHRFTPEEAGLLAAEAHDRATAIAGRITQVMAKLDVQMVTSTSECASHATPTAEPADE